MISEAELKDSNSYLTTDADCPKFCFIKNIVFVQCKNNNNNNFLIKLLSVISIIFLFKHSTFLVYVWIYVNLELTQSILLCVDWLTFYYACIYIHTHLQLRNSWCNEEYTLMNDNKCLRTAKSDNKCLWEWLILRVVQYISDGV